MFDWLKKKAPPPQGPDFAGIDSLTKAEAMFRRGELEKMFLLPLEFGGQDIPDNYVFVPLGLANVKWGIDTNVIRPMIVAGAATQYIATPKYQGNSFVPISITIVASDPGHFTTDISIWGEALGRS